MVRLRHVFIIVSRHIVSKFTIHYGEIKTKLYQKAKERVRDLQSTMVRLRPPAVQDRGCCRYQIYNPLW